MLYGFISSQGGPISAIDTESLSAKLVEAYATVLRPKIRTARKFFHFVDELAKDELQRSDQLRQLSAGIGEGVNIKLKFNRHWTTIFKMQRQLKEGQVSVEVFLHTVTNLIGISNTTANGEQSNEVADDDGEDTVAEIPLPLCEECGAAEQRKIVLQPCGHVWSCQQCYEEKSSNSQIACPMCKAIAKGHSTF